MCFGLFRLVGLDWFDVISSPWIVLSRKFLQCNCASSFVMLLIVLPSGSVRFALIFSNVFLLSLLRMCLSLIAGQVLFAWRWFWIGLVWFFALKLHRVGRATSHRNCGCLGLC